MRLRTICCLLAFLVASWARPGIAQAIDPQVQALIDESEAGITRDDKAIALTTAREALKLAIEMRGEDSLSVAAAEYQLERAGREQVDDDLLLQHLLHALQIRRRLLSPDSSQIAEVLTRIGSRTAYSEGRAVDAIAPLSEAIAIYQRNPPADSGDYELALTLLANAYRMTRQRQLAAGIFQRLLEVAEQRHGNESQQVAFALLGLAEVKGELGDEEASKALRARSNLLLSRNNLSLPPLERAGLDSFYLMLAKRYEDAEALLRRALASTDTRNPGNRYATQRLQLQLAEVLRETERFGEAEAVLLEMMPAAGAGPGFDRLEYVDVLLSSLKLYEVQGLYKRGDRIVAMIETAYSRTGLSQTYQIWKIIDYYLKQGRFNEALSWSARAIKPLRDASAISAYKTGSATPEERLASRQNLFKHLEVFRAGMAVGHSFLPTLIVEDSFQVAQLARPSSVEQSLAKMAARQAQLGDTFAAKLRAVQDEHASLAAKEALLVRLLAVPVAERGGVSIEATRIDLERQREALRGRERELAALYPRYVDLMSQAPMTLAEVGALLKPDEAMIAYAVDIDASYAWVVRSDTTFVIPSTAGQYSLDHLVQTLRVKLTSGANPERPLEPMSPRDGMALYKAVFAGIQGGGSLKGINHLFIVADGPLQSVPFAVLPDRDGPEADWLAKRYAISYLPSVSALRALRQANLAPTGASPFVGFGDPDLGDSTAAIQLSPRAIYGGGRPGSRALVVDVSVLRESPELPDTATELRAVAALLGSQDSSIFLRNRATESVVKGMDLTPYRIISFATHGVMAGELMEGAEPGLVLTPPPEGTTKDDGYLSASEVSELKLNAEWVLLSACNTAAPSGATGAEGFSGLANAFLYAGARSLLVSHWVVQSEATTELVTRTMSNYTADPGASKAVALQRAMVELMGQRQYAHPYYWAPFVVVGD